MDTLNTKQRAYLKSLAHHLKPLVQIGKDGVTDAAVRNIEAAFNTRELLKIKVEASAPDHAEQTGKAIAERIEGAHMVHVIGHTVIMYRRHPEQPEIKLPERRT